MIPRYSRPQMAAIWEPANAFRIQLDIETYACEAQAALGVIPESAIIPYARGVMAALPANTNAGAANNFQYLRRITDFRDKGDFKADQYFSDRLRGFFRYTQSRFDVFDPGTLPFTNSKPRSTSVRTISRFCCVRWRSPI